MDILKIIKARKTTRKYINKPVSRKIIDKIIEAGRWAPSAHNLQPWHFVIIINKQIITELVILLKNPPHDIFTPIRILIKKSAEIIETAPALILVYNKCSFSRKAKGLGKIYFTNAYISEIESISAAIENMHLAATSLGVGMAWLAMPLLMQDKINGLLSLSDELVAILTLGYSGEKNKKSPRKPISEIITYIK